MNECNVHWLYRLRDTNFVLKVMTSRNTGAQDQLRNLLEQVPENNSQNQIWPAAQLFNGHFEILQVLATIGSWLKQQFSSRVTCTRTFRVVLLTPNLGLSVLLKGMMDSHLSDSPDKRSGSASPEPWPLS